MVHRAAGRRPRGGPDQRLGRLNDLIRHFDDETGAIIVAVAFFHGTADPFAPCAESLDALERLTVGLLSQDGSL